MSLNKKLAILPTALRHSVASVLEQINPSKLPYFNKQYNFETRYYKGISLLKEKSLIKQFEGIARFFPETQLESLLLDKNTASSSLLPFHDLAKIEDPLQQLLFADYRTYMVDDILVKVDRATMSASLEGREPLLDHRILEYAASIPSEIKFGNGAQKRILKHICHKYIPKSIMDRPKMGFGIPMVEWFNKEIGDLIEELLNEKYIEQQGIFSPKAIQAEIKQYQSNNSGNVHRLWNILMFQLWYKKWM
jgi:asparagine synthase (glutamine-hydrolysing)